MGRPPQGGGPAFRFTQAEVAEMEAHLQEANNSLPPRHVVSALAEKFSASPDRIGKMIVQPKQVWNWFQNRRYAQRAKTGRGPGRPSLASIAHDEQPSSVTASPTVSSSSENAGKTSSENGLMEFEAKSARDGAWYDVSAFLSHRMFESSDPEVRVRFSGFGPEEDEWIDVHKCVRQRSLPCESAECVAVLPGDLILCFQEGKEQALYFDAHVLDVQRRRHDVRGCRCRFLVRYDHDQSEEIVPLRKVCRRPETDYRMHILQASRAAGTPNAHSELRGDVVISTAKDFNLIIQRAHKQPKLSDVKVDEVSTLEDPEATKQTVDADFTIPDEAMEDTAGNGASAGEVHDESTK